MKIILFAGGTGKRFWPVSRINAPKQFSPLINGKPLLRFKVDLMLKAFKPEDIFISTGKQYEKEVKQIAPELPEQNFILEPMMRDTGPAVTYATMYVDKLYPNAIISVQWSDHLIKQEDEFVKALLDIEKYIEKSEKIVFMTVPARFASPHRGYIHYGKVLKQYGKNTINEFVQFKEKPSIDTALEYIKDGHYGWNPGYWNMRTSDYLRIASKTVSKTYEVCKKIIDSNFDSEVLKEFETLEKISADYAFAEHVKAEDAVTYNGEFGWSDVGEWSSLKEALEESSKSVVTKGNIFDLDSEDSIFFNTQSEKLLATIGLKGMVVVNTQDVVAVFSKDDNSRLKEFLQKLEEKGLREYL